MRLKTWLKVLICHQKGAVAIEFALVAPILVLMMTGVVELGLAARTYLLATDAASDGASYATHNGWDTAKIANAVVESSSSRSISASPAAESFCGCPTSSGISRTTCGLSCSDGMMARRYAKIYASLNRPSVFAKVTTLPTIVTASATAQLP